MSSDLPASNATKKYYAIGEVAHLLNVSNSLIRFWEKNIPALLPQKNKQGARRYTQADIAQLSVVYQLVKKQGYTLRGAREALKHGKDVSQSNEAVLCTLKGLRSFLVALKTQLTDLLG